MGSSNAVRRDYCGTFPKRRADNGKQIATIASAIFGQTENIGSKGIGVNR
jgi:hypothetical protein